MAEPVRLRDEQKSEQESKPSKQLFLQRWTIVGLFILLAGLSLLYVWNAIAVDKSMKRIAELEKEREGLKAKNEQLRADVLRLTALDYISPLAQKKLGMMFPKKAAVDLTEPTY